MDIASISWEVRFCWNEMKFEQLGIQEHGFLLWKVLNSMLDAWQGKFSPLQLMRENLSNFNFFTLMFNVHIVGCLQVCCKVNNSSQSSGLFRPFFFFSFGFTRDRLRRFVTGRPKSSTGRWYCQWYTPSLIYAFILWLSKCGGKSFHLSDAELLCCKKAELIGVGSRSVGTCEWS